MKTLRPDFTTQMESHMLTEECAHARNRYWKDHPDEVFKAGEKTYKKPIQTEQEKEIQGTKKAKKDKDLKAVRAPIHRHPQVQISFRNNLSHNLTNFKHSSVSHRLIKTSTFNMRQHKHIVNMHQLNPPINMLQMIATNSLQINTTHISIHCSH